MATYFKKNLPLNNGFLRDLQVLAHSSQTDPSSFDRILRIARSVSNLCSDKEIDALHPEWMAYSAESIDRSWYVKDEHIDGSGDTHVKYHSIDYYWQKVFSLSTSVGTPKYPTLGKLLKSILIISHGNADVERGFSINSNLVPENRSLLSEFSINGLRTVRDAIKFFGVNSVHQVIR